jgi:RNA polymerase sigma-70 factor (ECF subfamily)
LDPQNQLLRGPGTEPDRQLVLEIAGGSSEALGLLYDRYARVVYAMARRMLHQVEDAEEVVQDVFSQVWREARRYQATRASVAGWIVMLARTRSIDRLRSRMARPDVVTAVAPDAAPPIASRERDPEQVAMAEQHAEAVRGALQRLPESQRILMELTYYDGLTQTEIAARTGVPLGTVKTRIRTAMATLTAALTV